MRPPLRDRERNGFSSASPPPTGTAVRRSAYSPGGRRLPLHPAARDPERVAPREHVAHEREPAEAPVAPVEVDASAPRAAGAAAARRCRRRDRRRRSAPRARRPRARRSRLERRALGIRSRFASGTAIVHGTCRVAPSRILTRSAPPRAAGACGRSGTVAATETSSEAPGLSLATRGRIVDDDVGRVRGTRLDRDVERTAADVPQRHRPADGRVLGERDAETDRRRVGDELDRGRARRIDECRPPPHPRVAMTRRAPASGPRRRDRVAPGRAGPPPRL